VTTPKLVTFGQKEWLEYTKQVSALVRTLGLSAFASAWLLAGALGQKAVGPVETLHLLQQSHALVWAASGAILALVFDFLQYLIGAVMWGLWSWSASVLTDPNTPSEHPQYRAAFRVAQVLRLTAALEPQPTPTSSVARRAKELAQRIRANDQTVDDRLAVEGANALVKFPPLLFFGGKCVALLGAYVGLLCYLF
jgi:hypothetical protein